MTLKETYQNFLLNNELEMLLPEAKGTWEEDEHAFKKAYEEINESLTSLDDDEEE